MEAYKPYLDYILSGGVAETAYILSSQGVVCATNLPIKELPRYQFELEDQKDPNIKHKIVVDERLTLLDALKNKGVTKHKEGFRLFNQKYYLSNYDADQSHCYFKKSKGGACVCQTKKFILIGTWNSEMKMQNGVAQNPGELNKRVEALADNLKKQGN